MRTIFLSSDCGAPYLAISEEGGAIQHLGGQFGIDTTRYTAGDTAASSVYTTGNLHRFNCYPHYLDGSYLQSNFSFYIVAVYMFDFY